MMIRYIVNVITDLKIQKQDKTYESAIIVIYLSTIEFTFDTI